MNIDELTKEIDRLLSHKEHILVAIDGPCAAGKTTLAEKLREKYDANVFHADDFFLRPEQRTTERLEEVGGNLDRERFFEEILSPLKEDREFSYNPFSCKTQSLSESVSVCRKKLNIIEGSYSHHPYFGNIYDLKVFLDIPRPEQKKRILLRNAEKTQMFFDRWIPLEDRYFDFFNIKEKADIVL